MSLDQFWYQNILSIVHIPETERKDCRPGGGPTAFKKDYTAVELQRLDDEMIDKEFGLNQRF